MSGPLSRYWNLHIYISWCIVFISIVPPNMRLQVEAQLRTPGIIALVTFLLTRVLLSTQTSALSINIFPKQARDAKGTRSYDDKDISAAFDSR